jgi:hypothetical protein
LDSGAGIDPISGAGSQDFSQLKEASAVDEKRGGLMRNWKVHQKISRKDLLPLLSHGQR